MRKQAKAQDALDIPEVERHPMWTPPTDSEQDELPGHVFMLRKEIAKRLTPFDGRPDSELILDFAKGVHLTTALETAHKDPMWLIGQIVVQRHRAMARLARIEEVCQPATKSLYATERAAIGALGDHFVEAVVKEVR